MGVGNTALRSWVDQLKAGRVRTTPKARAITVDQQKIQALQAQLKKVKRKNYILIKGD